MAIGLCRDYWVTYHPFTRFYKIRHPSIRDPSVIDPRRTDGFTTDPSRLECIFMEPKSPPAARYEVPIRPSCDKEDEERALEEAAYALAEKVKNAHLICHPHHRRIATDNEIEGKFGRWNRNPIGLGKLRRNVDGEVQQRMMKAFSSTLWPENDELRYYRSHGFGRPGYDEEEDDSGEI